MTDRLYTWIMGFMAGCIAGAIIVMIIKFV